MPFQPAPTCANATLRFERIATGEFQGQHSFNFKKASEVAMTQGDVELIRDMLAVWMQDHYDGIISNGVQLVDITVRGIASQVDVTTSMTPNLAGTNAAEALPSKVTLAVAFGTGMTGRTARGRVFTVGMVESHTEGNTVTEAYAEAAVAVFEELRDAAALEGYPLVVLSRWLNGVKRTNALPQEVTDIYLTDTLVDTRRNRKP